MCRFHCSCRRICKSSNTGFQNALQKRPDHVKGQPEHHSHDADKCRNPRIFSRQETVYFPASYAFSALFRFHNIIHADVFYVVKPHLGDCRGTVQSGFLFRLSGNLLQNMSFIYSHMKLFQNFRIAFHDLACGKTYRYLRTFCMVFDQMHDRMDSSVYPLVFFTVIRLDGTFLIFCHMDGMSDQLVNPLAFCR